MTVHLRTSKFCKDLASRHYTHLIVLSLWWRWWWWWWVFHGYFLAFTAPTLGWRSIVTLWLLSITRATYCGFRPPFFDPPVRSTFSTSPLTSRCAYSNSDPGLTTDGNWTSTSTRTLEIWSVSYIHCVPKKWRQNSNHYNYGISYQN